MSEQDTPTVKDDTETFVETPKFVQLVDGSQFPVPICTWGTEIRLIKLLGGIILEIWKSGAFSGQATTNTIGELLKLLFTDSPERITDAAAAILGQETEFVETRLNGEGVLKLVLPFLQSRLNSILGEVNRQVGSLQSIVAIAQSAAAAQVALQ